MSAPEAPAETEARQILDALEHHGQRIEALTEAINGLGGNVQWIIDMAQNIFPMFMNPAFGSMVQGMVPGMAEQMKEMSGDGLEADGA